MVMAGVALSKIVEFLRDEDEFVLTPFNFLMVFRQAVGVPMPDSRTMLEVFDADMNPLSSIGDVDRMGDRVLARYRSKA